MAASALFRDHRAGWMLAAFPPTWVMFTSGLRTEAVWLLLITVGVYLCLQRRMVTSALLIGLSGVVRPWSCFVEVAMLYLIARRESTSPALKHGAVALGVTLAGYVLAEGLGASGFGFLRAYEASDYEAGIFSWPFASLVMTPFTANVPIWKVVYIWGYAAVTLSSLAIYLTRILGKTREKSYWRQSLALWLAGTVLFVSTIGGIYGFHEFDRFTFSALPPLVLPFLSVLPRKRWFWVAVGLVSALVALLGETAL